MTKMILACLALVPSLAMAQEPTSTAATAETATATATPQYFTAAGEGKTLPERVFRFRLPFKFLKGDKLYDEDGKLKTLPVDISVNAGALVLEYGLSDRLSLQMKTNFYLSQKQSVKSDADIRKSDFYKDTVTENQEKQLNAFAQGLVDQGACASIAACRTVMASGLAPSSDQTINGIPFKAGVPYQTTINAVVENLVFEGAKNGGHSGKSGIGDTDIGALYAILTKEESPVAVSVGAGIRLPTGTSVVEDDEMETGGGTTDLGLRFNLDYPPVPGLMFSWQNQSEVMLLKGKAGTPDNKIDRERKGVRNIGFLKAAWGIGMLNPTLTPLGLYTSYNYDLKSNEKDDGTYAYSKAPRVYSATFGTFLDGLSLQIPLQLELEYEMSLGGRNAPALNAFGTTLKAYYRF